MKKSERKTSFVLHVDDTVKTDPAVAWLAEAGFVPRRDYDPDFKSVDLIEWCRLVRLRRPGQKRGRWSGLKVRHVGTRGKRQWCAYVLVHMQWFSDYGATPADAVRALASTLLSGVVVEEE